MSPITESTVIKTTLKTLRVSLAIFGSGLIGVTGLYYGLREFIKDTKNEILTEIKDDRARQALIDQQQDNDIQSNAKEIVRLSDKLVLNK